MSLLGSFSRKTSCSVSPKAPFLTLFRPHLQGHTTTTTTTTTTATTHTHSRPHHHHHHHQHQHQHQSPRRRKLHTQSRRPSSTSLTLESAESLFFDALARASLCKDHARPRHPPSPTPVRCFTTRSPKNGPPHASAALAPEDHPPQSSAIAIPKDKLRSLVDQYDYTDYGDTPGPPPEPEPEPEPEPPSHESPPDVPHPPRTPLRPPTPYVREAIAYLELLLVDELTSHSVLSDAYKTLPSPGVSYLSTHTIRRLMHRLSVVEYRHEKTMLRYLYLVDEMFAADIPMTRLEWNSAIAFAGRYVRKVSDVQVESATQIWLRMEKEAGIQSSSATFGILFGIAAKAEKFALAELIMKEMAHRNLRPNRYFRTNKIYYHGLRRDGDGVRAAYKELVDSGQLVDTIVLNCLIASLIKAGEAPAAEHVFERMKGLDVESGGKRMTVRGWRGRRELGKVLNEAARSLRHLPDRREVVQDSTPIAPNLHTYRLLIKYHAHESGNIDRIAELLDELHIKDIPIHGSVFFQLFRGFQFHGGVRYSSWTKPRLDNLWRVFCTFVETTGDRSRNGTEYVSEEDRGCYFHSAIVIVVLNAYLKVAGKEVVLQVWDDILELWKPEAKDLEAVNTALAYMLA